MLLLWDNIIEGYAAELSHMTRSELCELSVRGVEGTVLLFDPPFVEYFPPATASLFDSTLASCRSASPLWRLESGLVSDFYLSLDSLPSVPIRPGVGPFLMALTRLVGGIAETMDADVALEILSACYESILLSQLTGRVTVEMQENNDMCRKVIRFQEELIAEYQAR
ncbi:hypothetical protein [Micromonospora sp. NPDC005324]|uniref:hypothetical protein n=1 Tax=Micromonospora sp. NPDC005324 TaxID=3157033 RepID=UPI0033A0FADC